MANEGRKVEVGVFIPVGNGGWIISTNSPEVTGSYQSNLAATQLAESMGFDFALSMACWRGYGGETRHWEVALESLTAMAGLAQATSTINVWGTVHMMIFPPAIVAKMAATIDQISGGRFGMNLVTGSNPVALGQMGLWRDLDHEQRYELGEEWIKLVRRLWTEDRVTHKGTYFETNDCMSYPKPQKLPPVICAGQSDRGFRFTVENCNGAFLVADDSASYVSRARRAKQIARELGRPEFKTYGLFTLIPGVTDKEAQERLDWFNAGVDAVALANQSAEYGSDVSVKQNQAAQHFLEQGKSLSSVMQGTMTGSVETLARRVAHAVIEGELDGITIIVPDFAEDLKTIGQQVVPMMREMGVDSNVVSR